MHAKSLSTALRSFTMFAVILSVTSGRAVVKWHETVLHSFGSFPDGVEPRSGLISDAAGNLYGTTISGGTFNYGTVYELSPSEGGGWTEMVLHSFNQDGVDGYYPDAALIFDAAGNLYGTTQYGPGNGVVFELSPSKGGGWNEKVLYHFSGYGDGQYPHASLVFDAAGNLYGETDNGGIYCDLHQGCGTVFELSRNGDGTWTEKVLHSFGNGTDGEGPLGGLILDASGNLYGTTYGGGTYNPGGTVFELSPNGDGSWTETVLHSFGLFPDGAEPWGGLTFDKAGNLYGTTSTGGAYPNGGTVFELTPNGDGTWTETVLHSFGNVPDGLEPLYGSLIFDAVGNLYGTTTQGGIDGYGTVFELSPDGSGGWTETVLYNFGAPPDATYPASVILDAAGDLYGTSLYGGDNSKGTVFELTPVYPCLRCRHAGLP